MATVPGRYIYAVDRIDVMEDRRQWIARQAVAEGIRPPEIRIIRSARDAYDVGGSKAVRQEIAKVPEDMMDSGDHVIIISHEALKGANWTGFERYHLIIDEVPVVWDHEEVTTPALYEHMTASYDLVEVPGKSLRKVVPKPDCVTLAAYQRDQTLDDWVVFHKRAISQHGVYTDLLDWHEMADGRKWSWFSRWDVRELSPFREVWIVGNAFTDTVTYELMTKAPLDGEPREPVEFLPLKRAWDASKWARRSVKLRYFAEQHIAGATKWTAENSPYRDHQHRWAEWVRENSDHYNHYWSMNKAHAGRWAGRSPRDSETQDAGKIPGECVSPKVAGRNDLRHITVASICYSAKGKPAEIAAFKNFDITAEQIAFP